jgi:DNA-binding MarR family transcriptional regulator
MKRNEENNDRSAGRLINELSRAAQIYFQNEFKKYSIGHAQIRSLLFMARNEGISQLELSEYLNLDKSSITSQLRILERNGYISRHTSENDARINKIYITDKTREILEPLEIVFLSWTETLLDNFNESERTDIFEYLHRMHTNALNKLEQISIISNE